MTNPSDTLAALSEAATQGEWRDNPWHWGRADVAAYDDDDASPNKVNGRGFVNVLTDGTFEDARFIVALVNAYRTGQLVPVPSVDDMARILWIAEGFDAAHWDGTTGRQWAAYMDGQKPKYLKRATAVIAAMQEEYK